MGYKYLIILLLLVGISYADWYDTTYQNRIIINVTNSNATHTLIDYAMNITIDTSEMVAQGMSSDCSDLRFVNTSNINLEFWIENACNKTDTLIHVKIPRQLPDSTYEIEMYYNTLNASVPLAQNAIETFIFFADGDDASNWNVTHGTATVRNLSGELGLDLFLSSKNAVGRNLPNYTNGTQIYQWEGIFIENAAAGEIDLNIILTGSIVTDRLTTLITRDNGVDDDVLARAAANVLTDPYPNAQYNSFRKIVFEEAGKVSYFMWNNDTNALLGSFDFLDYVTTTDINGTENLNITDEVGSVSNTSWQYMRIRPYVSPDLSFILGSIEQQTPNLTSCSGASGEVTTLNITLFDELSKNITLGDMEMLFTLWQDKDNLATSTFSFTNTTSEILCLDSANITLTANATIQYQNLTGFPDREHYLVNLKLNDTIQHIDLYMLETDLATPLEIKVEDQSSIPVVGVVVAMQRLYLNENNWSTVGMVFTDTDGIGITRAIDSRIQDRTVFYRFIVNQDGTIITTTTGGALTSNAETTIFKKVIIIGVSVGEFYEILQSLINDCTNTSSVLSCSYSDTTLTLTSMRLLVYQNQTIGTITLCDLTNTNSSGTFTCNLGTTANNTYFYEMVGSYSSGTDLKVASGVLFFGVPSIFGAFGAFLALFFAIPLIFIGRWSPPVAILLGLFGIIGMWALGFLFVGPEAIIGLVIAGGIAMFLMKERRV